MGTPYGERVDAPIEGLHGALPPSDISSPDDIGHLCLPFSDSSSTSLKIKLKETHKKSNFLGVKVTLRK